MGMDNTKIFWIHMYASQIFTQPLLHSNALVYWDKMGTFDEKCGFYAVHRHILLFRATEGAISRLDFFVQVIFHPNKSFIWAIRPGTKRFWIVFTGTLDSNLPWDCFIHSYWLVCSVDITCSCGPWYIFPPDINWGQNWACSQLYLVGVYSPVINLCCNK